MLESEMPPAHHQLEQEPSRLQRYHCRIVQDDGRSVPLDDIYPVVRPAYPVQ